MKKKISLNAVCFMIAGCLSIAIPVKYAVAATISETGLKSTGNVVYDTDGFSITGQGGEVVQFSKDDLVYLINRVENDLAPICK